MALKAELSSRIAALVDGGVTGFLSGMALATDTWAAMAVLELREKNPALKLHCILPCKGQEVKWSDSAREQYHWILEEADSRVYVNRKYHENCMMERNHFLVDYSDILLAVCADPNERRSGTAATIRYARKSGKEIILLNPLTLCVTHEGP